MDGGQFRNCSQLERIEFSAKIQRLDGTAFCGCFQLQKWDVDLNNPYLRVEGPFLMTADGKELLCTLPRVSGAVVMPSGLEVIGPYAFQCCTRLTSVTLPSGVRSVANSAYVECSQLSEVIFPDSLTEIGAGAFQHCFALKQVVLPQGLKQIGYQSFENTTKLLRTKPLSDSDTTSAAHLRPSNSKDFVIQNGELKRYIGTDNQVSCTSRCVCYCLWRLWRTISRSSCCICHRCCFTRGSGANREQGFRRVQKLKKRYPA